MGRLQFLNIGCDLARCNQTRRTHRLQVALACPVGDTTDVIEMTVAHEDSGHRWQRAVSTARVEGQVELGEEDQGTVPGARPADHGQ